MTRRQKIVSLSTLRRRLPLLRRQGRIVAWTNGCFDLLHAGHVTYLQKAKKADRVLIVGLNSDASVRAIKGDKRPIVPQHQRAVVVAALACVDFVTIFDEETPLNAIRVLKPDVLIKGADWRGKGVVGEQEVRSHGGRVEYIAFVEQWSSTRIIETIVERYHGR